LSSPLDQQRLDAKTWQNQPGCSSLSFDRTQAKNKIANDQLMRIDRRRIQFIDPVNQLPALFVRSLRLEGMEPVEVRIGGRGKNAFLHDMSLRSGTKLTSRRIPRKSAGPGTQN
jgi:hypothetical protein